MQERTQITSYFQHTLIIYLYFKNYYDQSGGVHIPDYQQRNIGNMHFQNEWYNHRKSVK